MIRLDYGFGDEQRRSEVPFLSYLTQCKWLVSTHLLMGNVNLDSSAKVGFTRFSTVKLPFLPVSILYSLGASLEVQYTLSKGVRGKGRVK